MKKLIYFWIDSYRSDPTAFKFEVVSFVFTVWASMSLALNADNPSMVTVYPLFLIGSVTQFIASLRRRAAWIALLTFYFACINIFGFFRAIAWI